MLLLAILLLLFAASFGSHVLVQYNGWSLKSYTFAKLVAWSAFLFGTILLYTSIGWWVLFGLVVYAVLWHRSVVSQRRRLSMKAERARREAHEHYFALAGGPLPAPHEASGREINTIWTLGKWLIDKRKFPIAVALLEPYEQSGHAGLCNSLGVAYGNLGDWEQALRAHAKARALEPHEAIFLFTYGIAAYCTRQHKAARASFAQYLESADCDTDKRTWIVEMLAEIEKVERRRPNAST